MDELTAILPIWVCKLTFDICLISCFVRLSNRSCQNQK